MRKSTKNILHDKKPRLIHIDNNKNVSIIEQTRKRTKVSKIKSIWRDRENNNKKDSVLN